MTGLDERVDLGRIRDLEGRRSHPWIRRALLGLLGVAVLLALTGAIGQPTRALERGVAGARLHVEVPDVLRGGLLWRARIEVRATRTIDHPRIVLGPGYAEGNQLNTIEPGPQSEAGRDGRIVLSYPKLNFGDELVVYVQSQVDPTTIGVQDASVELDDESHPLVHIPHTIRVLP